MRQARTWRLGAWLLLAGWAAMVGCTHNYYYGTGAPICGEPVAPTTVVPGGYGAVCDVPTQVNGGSLVAQGPNRTIVANAPRPSQVLVSEPRDTGPVVRGPGRFSWRRSDPDSLATTKVDGALEDGSVNR